AAQLTAGAARAGRTRAGGSGPATPPSWAVTAEPSRLGDVLVGAVRRQGDLVVDVTLRPVERAVHVGLDQPVLVVELEGRVEVGLLVRRGDHAGDGRARQRPGVRRQHLVAVADLVALLDAFRRGEPAGDAVLRV